MRVGTAFSACGQVITVGAISVSVMLDTNALATALDARLKTTTNLENAAMQQFAGRPSPLRGVAKMEAPNSVM